MARSALDLRRTSDEILRELIATLAREVAHEAKAIADLERKSLPEASASSTHDRDADDPLQVPVKEAARLLGFCRQTLYRMRADGQIAFRKMRGRVMVPMSEIKRLAGAVPEQATNSEPIVPKDRPKRRPKKMKLFPRDEAVRR